MASERLTPDNYAWYDRMIGKGYAERNESYFSAYLSHDHSDAFKQILLAAGGEHARALDIGCGPGKYTEMLTPGYAYVVGLDRSVKSLTYGLVHHRRPNLAYVLGDAQRLPFGDASFEAVAARLAPHNLVEMLRILRPQGLAICMRVGENDAYRLREIFKQQNLVEKMRQYIEWGEPHSRHIVEQWKQIGFTEVSSGEYEYDMHFETTGDLANYLSRVPIIPEFDANDANHMHKLREYAEQHTHPQMTTVVLHRHRYISVVVVIDGHSYDSGSTHASHL